MGYACPVCETPQSDARHLANHLAFTAMLGNDDHETWLDEHAPDWERAGESELAERVVEHADEVEFPQVFEDTIGHEHDHGDGPRPGDLFADDSLERSRGPNRGDSGLDSETAAAIERARKMTQQADDEDGSNADENG